MGLNGAYSNPETSIIDAETGTPANIDDRGNLRTSLGDLAGRHVFNTVFGEQLTGTRVPSVASQFQYGIASDFANTVIVGSGTAATDDALLDVETGTDANGACYIETRDYLRYIPGHEAYLNFTAVFNTPAVDSYQRVGLFDDDNGFFIGYEGLDFKLTRRRAGVDVSMNVTLADVFPSQFGEFDPSMGNIYKISFGYLGFATIHFEVMTPEGGWSLVGEFQYPNTQVTTHIAQTNLPGRAQIANAGNTTNLKVSIGSFSFGIVDGGGTDPAARTFSFASGTVAVVGGETQLVTFRSKATFNGIANRIRSQLLLLSAATDLVKIASWQIVKNATITNVPTWADVNTTDSTFEYSTDATVTLSAGTVMIPWSMGRVDSFFENVKDYDIALRPEEWATIAVTTTGAGGDVSLGMRWKELF